MFPQKKAFGHNTIQKTEDLALKTKPQTLKLDMTNLEP